PSLAWLLLWELRIPRTLLGLLVGATLGLSGAVLQGLLRNPLAEPGLLGVSAGASLGAVIAIYLGVAASFALATPLLGIAGALAARLEGGSGLEPAASGAAFHPRRLGLPRSHSARSRRAHFRGGASGEPRRAPLPHEAAGAGRHGALGRCGDSGDGSDRFHRPG